MKELKISKKEALALYDSYFANMYYPTMPNFDLIAVPPPTEIAAVLSALNHLKGKTIKNVSVNVDDCSGMFRHVMVETNDETIGIYISE